MLGAERTTFRAVDDGEPSSTAGRPILGQINSCQLTNVLVIVVRYFGGILLGTSGLINAYKEAAAAAIENAQIEEKIVKSAIQVTFKYPQLNDIMRVVKEQDLEVSGQEFGFDENKMTLWVRNSQLNAVKEKIKQILI
jgi:putative IMPACT (imprinted ancient) family translation regulator